MDMMKARNKPYLLNQVEESEKCDEGVHIIKNVKTLTLPVLSSINSSYDSHATRKTQTNIALGRYNNFKLPDLKSRASIEHSQIFPVIPKPRPEMIFRTSGSDVPWHPQLPSAGQKLILRDLARKPNIKNRINSKLRIKPDSSTRPAFNQKQTKIDGNALIDQEESNDISVLRNGFSRLKAKRLPKLCKPVEDSPQETVLSNRKPTLIETRNDLSENNPINLSETNTNDVLKIKPANIISGKHKLCDTSGNKETIILAAKSKTDIPKCNVDEQTYPTWFYRSRTLLPGLSPKVYSQLDPGIPLPVSFENLDREKSSVWTTLPMPSDLDRHLNRYHINRSQRFSNYMQPVGMCYKARGGPINRPHTPHHPLMQRQKTRFGDALLSITDKDKTPNFNNLQAQNTRILAMQSRLKTLLKK